MKAYIDFGDYSKDGHCQSERILVEIPNINTVIMATKIIEEEYGQDIFTEMACEYEVAKFGKRIWDLLLYLEYPMERLEDTLDGYNLDGLDSLKEFLEVEPDPYVNIEFVIDAYIWILNSAGANIMQLDTKDDIPVLNWTPGFKTVGYGCFE